jgi:hypothetical protein
MMNNDAFRELFKQGGKSTKEIAREAVEDEFQRNTKKRKKRGGGGDSSDEEDDDDKKQHKNKKHQHKKRSSSKKDDDDDDDDATNNYRDRAQERREGKVDEREFATTDFQGSAEMSKYLGGDERHTHLVKGLDVTLAQKVKREMGKLIDSHRTAVPVSKKKQQAEEKQQEEELKMVETKSEATQLIKDWSADHKPSSQLGQSMLIFLQQRLEATVKQPRKHLQVSSAGYALQRSSLTFSCVSHPGDVWRAWEVPEELTSMADNSNNDRETWWNVSLLDQVQEAFTRNDKKMTQALSTRQKLSTSTNGTGPSKREEGDNDSSDDDIFADAGDYVPTTTKSNVTAATGTKSTGATTTATKTSLFSGLTANQQEEQDEAVHEDGLTIVAKLAQKAKAIPKSGDFSQYDGAYGDDGMDMDFAGQCDDDDETTKKKGKGEESTMASREYGKRGKPQKEGTFED